MKIRVWLNAESVEVLCLPHYFQPRGGLLSPLNPLSHQLDAVVVPMLDLKFAFNVVIDEFIDINFSIFVVVHLLKQDSQDFFVKAVFCP